MGNGVGDFGLQRFNLPLLSALLGEKTIDLFHELRFGDAEHPADALHSIGRLLELRNGAFTGDGLDAADTGGDAALGDDLEAADVSGARHVSAAAKLLAEVRNRDDADFIAIFFPEQ